MCTFTCVHLEKKRKLLTKPQARIEYGIRSAHVFIVLMIDACAAAGCQYKIQSSMLLRGVLSPRRIVRAASALQLPVLPRALLHNTTATMADAAAPAETLFEKIAAKKIPSVAVYEDELAYAFRDINPTVRSAELRMPGSS